MCSPESGKEEARETRVWASQGSPVGGQEMGVGHRTFTHFARSFTEEGRNMGGRDGCKQLGREASKALAPWACPAV